MAEQKKGQIQIFAKNIKGNARGGILEESKFTRNTAGGRHIQNGGNGVNNDTNRQRTILEETRVKTIECLDELDLGSQNDTSGRLDKEGVILNKTYRFRVKDYTNGEPKNPNNIRWSLKYTNPETGQQELNILKNKDYNGIQLNINFTERECCGSEMEVRAYIEDPESEGKFSIFHHNRFRWFDRKKLRDEINLRKENAWLIDQKSTNTCGPSAVMYSFAKKDKEAYSKFILDLHRTGYAKNNDYEINVESDGDLKDIAETNPTTMNNFPSGMASSDWISNTCITEEENVIFDYEGNTKEDFSAITLPSRIEKLAKSLIGFSDVVDNTNLYYTKTGWAWGSTLENVAELIQVKNDGYEVFLLVGMNILYNKTSNSLLSTAEHWIVLETIMHGKPGFVEFTVYTWGQKPELKTYNVSYDIFRTNYYGYVKAK